VEEFFTVDEVAKTFKVTRATVYEWMRSGDLAYVQVGGRRRVTQSAMNAFIKEGKPEEDQQIEETQRDIKVPGLALAW
jgi:excisionase family DNA binding protein